MITRLHNTARIYQHLCKDRSLFAYHIGDLDKRAYVDFIGLSMRADNAPAIVFYQRIGFSIASTRVRASS